MGSLGGFKWVNNILKIFFVILQQREGLVFCKNTPPQYFHVSRDNFVVKQGMTKINFQYC